MAVKSKRVTVQTIRENKNRDLSPKWDGADQWNGDQFTSHFRKAMNYYRLESSVKDLKPKLIEWMNSAGYSKTESNAVRKIKDKYFNSTMVAIAACFLKGMPEVHKEFNNGKNTGAWLRQEIEKVLELGSNDLEEDEETPKSKKPQVTYVPSIQDRLREAAGDMSEEIDYAIDSFIADPESFDPKAFKMANLLRAKGAKAVHARMIKSYFISGYEELMELAGGKADEQLREAYGHLPRKHVRKLIEFYESIISACDQIAAEQKVLKKPRAKKAKPAEELVKNIKFKVTDDKLGIASVPPAQLIGAQLAVVYNTKTRKIGVYQSKTSEGLGVKGTSILNFTEKSLQKTLRKPDTQLKEFKEQNTQKRVETWFTKIKSTEIKLNGRINAEVMILKCFK